ncbi:hypothetical protein DW969_07850 [Eubacterium sp. AM47-9]|nr:hypothetical protein DW969_07850 [Eubacterium sp. AM47-9]
MKKFFVKRFLTVRFRKERKSFLKEERVVENQSRAWIHCRVSTESNRYLLHYQEKRLMSYCESENLKVVGVTKEVGLGKGPREYYISTIATIIRRKEIDYLVLYDWTRLLIFKDLYMMLNSSVKCMVLRLLI